MKKIICLLILSFCMIQISLAQNVGIGTTTPLSTLDINGDIAMRSAEITITSVYNIALDVNTTKQANYKLLQTPFPPVGNFIIAGITSAADGRIITLANRTGSSFEIYNDDANAAGNDRIKTGTGSTFAVYNGGTVTLKYDASIQKWEVMSSHYNSLDYFGGGGGGSYWNLNGTDITNSNAGNVGIGTASPVRAKLELAGVAGSGNTSAIFGGDGNGISIQRNWPSIGFNQYRDGPTGLGKAIASGYGMNMNLNPSTGLFSIDILDSVGTNAEITGTPKRSINIFKNGFIHIGSTDISNQATLSISGSSNYPSHFNFGSDGHTYIRGGNKTYGGAGIFSSRRPSKIYLNDLAGEHWQTGVPTAGGDVIMVTGGGNVGVGVSAPSNKLSVLNTVLNASNNTDVIEVAGANPMINFSTQNLQPFTYIKGITDLTNSPQFARTGIEIGAGGLDIYFTSAGYQPALMINGTNNNVGIGTNTPAHKLSVNGTIRSKEVIVESNNWPDYVFDKNYKLPSLETVEHFISIHKHLPGIPAAEQIKKDGLKFSEIQTKMMEKIEELTLYIIELKKEIDTLKKQSVTPYAGK